MTFVIIPPYFCHVGLQKWIPEGIVIIQEGRQVDFFHGSKLAPSCQSSYDSNHKKPRNLLLGLLFLVIKQHADRGTVSIVKLACFHAPDESNEEDHRYGQGNEDEWDDDGHGVQGYWPLSFPACKAGSVESALPARLTAKVLKPTTLMLEIGIRMAATMGVR